MSTIDHDEARRIAQGLGKTYHLAGDAEIKLVFDAYLEFSNARVDFNDKLQAHREIFAEQKAQIEAQQEQLTAAWSNRDRFCAEINVIGHEVLGFTGNCAPDAVSRETKALVEKLKAENETLRATLEDTSPDWFPTDEPDEAKKRIHENASDLVERFTRAEAVIQKYPGPKVRAEFADADEHARKNRIDRRRNGPPVKRRPF